MPKSPSKRSKVCTQCGKRKKLYEFHRRSISPDGRRTECATCGKARAARYYQANKASKVRAVISRRKSTMMWVRGLKEEQGCSRCGEDCGICLDYHHRDPSIKLHNINVMVRRGFSREHILEEITKCDVVCSNCHRKLHAA